MGNKETFKQKYDITIEQAYNTYKDSDKLMDFFKKFRYEKGFKFYRDLQAKLKYEKQRTELAETFKIVYKKHVVSFLKACKKYKIEVELLERWKIKS